MKEIPWWLWLVAVGGGLYLWSKSSSGGTGVGAQVYIPASTSLYSDAAMTQLAGQTSAGGLSTVSQVQGNASQISVGGYTGSAGTMYWVATSALAPATAAQISASNAGTLS
jgi:hypothetical protein